MNNQNNKIKNTLPYIILVGVVVFVLIILEFQGNTVNNLSTGELIKELKEDKVTEITITPNSNESIYYIEGKLEGYKEGESFKTKVIAEEVLTITDYVDRNEIVEYDTNSDPGSNTILYLVLNVLPFVVTIILAYILFKRLAMSNKNSVDFGRSRARLSSDSDKKNFKDVAGLTEEKAEVEELIDFLKNPKKFQKLGARIPKGVLLVGPPGTGKTLLAKAVAGEANVPFFYISGSDFVELFVGVGASRVRDMFKEAKRSAPCLIFIDEIDAVGRQRGTGLGGGHDEREQTLNQLLVEMDGFGTNAGVIVLAATNRPDILDPALLRPGRFDRQIVIPPPDVKAREEILKVHANKKHFEDDVKFDIIAKNTSGFSGADLENLLNEAALLAARQNKTSISMQDVEEATIKVMMGPEKRSKVVSDKDKKLVAYHEAGHALVSRFLPTQDMVHQVSIVPRGMAGGYTMYRPNEDKSFVSKMEMEERIVSLLGGRVAEKLVLNDISTGASNDIERATKIARDMVTKYGMSDHLGPITFGTGHEEVFLGRDFAQSRNYSEEIASKIDSEIKLIIGEAYSKAERILNENMHKLHKIAEVLLEKEKIEADEFEEIFQNS